jgi:hypothetical protein
LSYLAGHVRQTAVTSGLPRGGGELVLVDDDESSVRTITKQTLEAFGYRVLTAADGADAVAVYARSEDEVAVVFTDMTMPSTSCPSPIRRRRCSWRSGTRSLTDRPCLADAPWVRHRVPNEHVDRVNLTMIRSRRSTGTARIGRPK